MKTWKMPDYEKIAKRRSKKAMPKEDVERWKNQAGEDLKTEKEVNDYSPKEVK